MNAYNFFARMAQGKRPPIHSKEKVDSPLSPWSVDEVAKLISSARNKTCQLDPAPTWLVKDMSGLVSPFIALIITGHCTTGCFPAEFKEAIVRPLLKRDGLGPHRPDKLQASF